MVCCICGAPLINNINATFTNIKIPGVDHLPRTSPQYVYYTCSKKCAKVLAKKYIGGLIW